MNSPNKPMQPTPQSGAADGQRYQFFSFELYEAPTAAYFLEKKFFLRNLRWRNMTLELFHYR